MREVNAGEAVRSSPDLKPISDNYEPPQAVCLGDTRRAAGACTTGSNFQNAGGNCITGGAAPHQCQAGASAGQQCQIGGSPAAACQTGSSDGF